MPVGGGLCHKSDLLLLLASAAGEQTTLEHLQQTSAKAPAPAPAAQHGEAAGLITDCFACLSVLLALHTGWCPCVFKDCMAELIPAWVLVTVLFH